MLMFPKALLGQFSYYYLYDKLTPAGSQRPAAPYLCRGRSFWGRQSLLFWGRGNFRDHQSATRSKT